MSAATRGSPRRRISIARARLTSARAAWSSWPLAGGQRERLLQHRPPALVLRAADQRRADVRQRVRDGLVVADPAGEAAARVPSAIASSFSLVQHRELRAAAQRHRQLAAVGERLQHRDRPVAERDGLLAAARPPQWRDDQRRSSPARSVVARRLVDREQRAARLGRALALPAEVGLDRDALERLRRRRASSAQRRLPLLERLPVAARRAPRRAATGARRRIARTSPARRAWWASRAGSALAGGLSAPSTRRSSSRAADGGELVLDGAAGEVVAEGERRRRGA